MPSTTPYITDSGQASLVGKSKVISRQRPRNLTKQTTVSRVNEPTGSSECLVCGVPLCNLVTHRLATLELLRRVSKTARKLQSDNSTSTSFEDVIVSTLIARTSPLPRTSGATRYSIDTFHSFPVKGVHKSTMRQFHDFFSVQGGSLLETDRQLMFDKSFYPFLFPQAMRNPALCMSIVAMASTFIAIHHRKVKAPDEEVLTTYGQCFDTLRKQIDLEGTTGLSESTIMAAVNLVMCCGIGFGDHEAALTHWNGVLALLDRANSAILPGRFLAFRDSMEYWLVLTAGLPPRQVEWPVRVLHELPPLEVYGKGFPRLFETQMMWCIPAAKLQTVCLNTCRATECLEDCVTDSANLSVTSPSTYFEYLRGIVQRQNIQAYSELANTDTVAECVSVTLNIFFLLVLRMTPWRAPIEHLCAQLRASLQASRLELEDDGNTPESETNDNDPETTRDVYLWMLIVYACALQFCHSEFGKEWAASSIRRVCRQDVDTFGDMWEQTTLQRMRLFCWSDRFLLKHFKGVCAWISDGCYANIKAEV